MEPWSHKKLSSCSIRFYFKCTQEFSQSVYTYVTSVYVLNTAWNTNNWWILSGNMWNETGILEITEGDFPGLNAAFNIRVFCGALSESIFYFHLFFFKVPWDISN